MGESRAPIPIGTTACVRSVATAASACPRAAAPTREPAAAVGRGPLPLAEVRDNPSSVKFGALLRIRQRGYRHQMGSFPAPHSTKNLE